MIKPKKYRKKPVVIEAMRLAGEPATIMYVAGWLEEHGYPWLLGNALYPDTLRARDQISEDPIPTQGIYIDPADGALIIRTLEGDMRAVFGDFIIRGVQGEFYPCKPDIFLATYSKEETQ